MAITEQDKLNQLKVLKHSYDMYEKTKKDTIKRMKTATDENGNKKYPQEAIDAEVQLIEQMQEDLIGKYQMFGGDPEDLKTRKKTTKTSSKTAGSDIVNMLEEEEKPKKVKTPEPTETIIEKDYLPNKNAYNPSASFDVIPLPSGGECYAHKTGKLPVAYLTAYDENIIISPNLYNDNKVLDFILKEKVLNDTIDTGELIDGDREAIILFLRASGYGNEYPITARDNATGVEFDTVIDLSKLKFKDFKLKGDANGWFDFTLPVSKKEVKFKFLTHNDMKTLERLDNIEDDKLKKNRIKDIVDELDELIDSEKELSNESKAKVRTAIRTIDTWQEGIDEEDAADFTHSITNKLILQIMSIDGVTDKKYIRDFVHNMNVKDARAIRRYINENEPGVDYNIEIQKPESLGGGSMTVFLQLDQYVFLNVAE